jgi:hypothetical protein
MPPSVVLFAIGIAWVLAALYNWGKVTISAYGKTKDEIDDEPQREVAALGATLLFGIARVAWKIVKVLVFVATLWGAIKSLTDTSVPVIGGIVRWAKTFDPSFFGGSFLSWVAANWMSFAVLVIFLNSVFSRAIFDKLEKTSTYMRIFMATMMNYFRVETETPATKTMKESGAWAVVKEGFSERLLAFILGVQPPDDSLQAKAVRRGREVELSDDLTEALGQQPAKQDDLDRW